MKKELILVGDKVLVDPDKENEKTDTGLYLPQGIKERERVRSGRIAKIGPGYPVPDPSLINQEPWLKNAPKDIILRAIQYYYLDKITNSDDLEIVNDQLDAIGISESNWTQEFVKEEEEEEEEIIEEKREMKELPGRDPKEFLDEVLEWLKERGKYSNREEWDWIASKDGKIIDMRYNTHI